MSTGISELNLAVEKLIEMISLHEINLRDMKMIQEFHTTKLDKVSAIDKFDDRLKTLESTVRAMSDRLTVLEGRLGLVELDATSDHQLASHNANVVQDWHAEAEVGINSDMIPLSKGDLLERFQRYQDRKKR